MKRSAHSKAVLGDSWITVDTTSLHRHKLYYCTYCHIVKVNSTGCVIQCWAVHIKGCLIQCLAERKFSSCHGQNSNKKINYG